MTPAPILVPGSTCCRLARADRCALIVDAADYFRAAKQAMLNARHSILLLGWDFDTRIELEPEGATLPGPNRLGRFVRWLAGQRPELQICILKWDLGLLMTLARGATPLFILDWMMSRRIRCKLDGNHPPGAAHHQKILVVDDAVGFCGGVDMTAERWDIREHRDHDHRRRTPGGHRYPPWHDATMVVDGPAARALGDLARQRWRCVTGEVLDSAPPGNGETWPAILKPQLRDIEVGISRTLAKTSEQDEIREIEALLLAAIASARRYIYVESVYFASRHVAEALAARLKEDAGPEIVVVNPQSAAGWLEEKTMGAARARLTKLLRQSDRRGRFGLYHAVNEGGTPIYIHAKILIVDDRLLKVGSANLNNRSMGYDSECDLVIEADAQSCEGRRNQVRQSIIALRDDLLAEHLGTTAQQIATAIETADGSLLRTIERLRGKARTLKPLDAQESGLFADALAKTSFLDPESTESAWRTFRGRLRIG